MKNLRKMSILGILCALAVVSFISTSCDTSTSSKIYTIRYLVTGTVETVNIMYSNDTRGMDQLDNISLPWEKTMRTTVDKHGTAFVSVGKSPINAEGSITARVFVNGQEKAYSSTETEYSVFASYTFP